MELYHFSSKSCVLTTTMSLLPIMLVLKQRFLSYLFSKYSKYNFCWYRVVTIFKFKWFDNTDTINASQFSLTFGTSSKWWQFYHIWWSVLFGIACNIFFTVMWSYCDNFNIALPTWFMFGRHARNKDQEQRSWQGSNGKLGICNTVEVFYLWPKNSPWNSPCFNHRWLDYTFLSNALQEPAHILLLPTLTILLLTKYNIENVLKTYFS